MTNPPACAAPPPRDAGASLEVAALLAVLGQLGDLLRTLTDAQYTAAPVGVFDHSIGGHVRHCLDHVRAFASGASGGGALDYDARTRGTAIEMSRDAALGEIDGVCRALAMLAGLPADGPLRVRVMHTPGGPSRELVSSVGRELAFVLSHTIHHNAITGAMARMLGAAVPASFGYAPATVAHHERVACAPSASSR